MSFILIPELFLIFCAFAISSTFFSIVCELHFKIMWFFFLRVHSAIHRILKIHGSGEHCFAHSEISSYSSVCSGSRGTPNGSLLANKFWIFLNFFKFMDLFNYSWIFFNPRTFSDLWTFLQLSWTYLKFMIFPKTS